MLSQSMSKSDLRVLNNRQEAQWRMNRLRSVHALRSSFEYLCITEGLGTPTTAPIDMYDRVQADAGCPLSLSKKEILRLFGRPGRNFCWTQLIRCARRPHPA